jgi:hypothetical protein
MDTASAGLGGPGTIALNGNLDLMAAGQGVELVCVALARSRHLDFVRLRPKARPRNLGAFARARLVARTLGRDAFILIEKMEDLVRSGSVDGAAGCALAASDVGLRTDLVDGRPAWTLEIEGYWVPVATIAARGGL